MTQGVGHRRGEWRRLLAGVVTGALLCVATPAFADHDGGDRYGSEDDRNRNRNRDRGAFSPGPFRDSPVTITICATPDSCPQNPPPEQP